MPLAAVPLLETGLKLLRQIIPDPQKRQEHEARLIELSQAGELQALEAQMQMIMAEAQSKDPWTSRARPSFLYVMYVFILAAIPFGAIFVFFPDNARAAIEGVRLWLDAMPGELYALFGAGYLGYTGARSYDKAKRLSG